MNSFRFILLSCLLLGLCDAFRSAFIPESGLHARAASKSTSTLCMSTIAVIGATGLTASECVYQALKNGDEVVGLARSVACVKCGEC